VGSSHARPLGWAVGERENAVIVLAPRPRRFPSGVATNGDALPLFAGPAVVQEARVLLNLGLLDDATFEVPISGVAIRHRTATEPFVERNGRDVLAPRPLVIAMAV
jgi:hypothetical protein